MKLQEAAPIVEVAATHSEALGGRSLAKAVGCSQREPWQHTPVKGVGRRRRKMTGTLLS